MTGHGTNGFAVTAGPPPGLHPYPAPPPGLGPNRSASSYSIPPGLGNGTMTNGSGQGTSNGHNMPNGSSYVLHGTNGHGHGLSGYGNNALGVGNGNGARFDQRSGLSSPWPNHYNSTTTPSPNIYAQAFAPTSYTSPPAGGYNAGSINGSGSYRQESMSPPVGGYNAGSKGSGLYRRGSRQASS